MNKFQLNNKVIFIAISQALNSRDTTESWCRNVMRLELPTHVFGLGLGLRFELHRFGPDLVFLKKSVLKSECSSCVKTQSEQWEQIYLWPWPRSEE